MMKIDTYMGLIKKDADKEMKKSKREKERKCKQNGKDFNPKKKGKVDRNKKKRQDQDKGGVTPNDKCLKHPYGSHP